MPARTPGLGRVVAGNREAEVQPERRCPGDDFRFRHRKERGAYAEAPALHAGLRPEVRRPLESLEKLGPAVRITGVVEGVGADEHVGRPDDLGPGNRVRQEERVARRNISDGDRIAAEAVCRSRRRIRWSDAP